VKTCLIIGNGPSLADIPNTFLDKYPTFGSNRVYLKYTPTYYAAVNPNVVTQFASEINQMNCVKYIRHDTHHLINDSKPLYCARVHIFSRDAHKWVCEGYTVTYVLMQLAYHYGFKRVGLVGVDHNYAFEGKPNQLLKAEGDDPNHFDPSYFSDGVAWNAPDLHQSEIHYQLAKTAFEVGGGEIVNLTLESQLSVFKRDDWRNW